MNRYLIYLLLLVASHSVYAQNIVPVGKHEKTTDLGNGIVLKYAERGDEKGLPVILLHGYTDSWHSFQTVMPYLSGKLHTFALSQRGHGNSSRPDSNYHPKDFAKDVAHFIRLKQLGPVIIVGHSMGGIIAQQFAIDYPQLTKAMVLVSTDAFFGDNPGVPEFADEIRKLSGVVDYGFAEAFQNATWYEAIDTVYNNLLIRESLKLPVFVWQRVMEGILSADYRALLSRIDKPVLIVWGEKDAFCFRADQEVLTKGLKRSVFVEYKESGHALHWEDPARFAAEVQAFIDQL